MNILVVDDNPIFRKTYRADPLFLSSKGHKVTVVCPKPVYAVSDLLRNHDVDFVFTTVWKTTKRGMDLLNKLVQIILNIVYIKRLLCKEQYDLIRAVGFVSAYSSLVARGGSSIPVVSNLTDFYSDMYRHFRLPGASIMTRLLDRMQRKIVTDSDILFVDSSTMRSYWTFWGLDEKRCIILPNGFDDDLFDPNADATLVKAEYGIGKRTKTVLYAGDISSNDGVDILIEAAPMILETVDVKFLILGGGTEKYLNSLKALVKKKKVERNVIFTGWVPYTLVPKYMAAADLCVAPFRINLTSNSTECLKIVEYVAMLKPVVAVEADGLRQLFGDMLTYVPPEDSEALATTIKEALMRKPLNAETITRMKRLREKFTWKNVWMNEERIFQTLSARELHEPQDFDIF